MIIVYFVGHFRYFRPNIFRNFTFLVHLFQTRAPTTFLFFFSGQKNHWPFLETFPNVFSNSSSRLKGLFLLPFPSLCFYFFCLFDSCLNRKNWFTPGRLRLVSLISKLSLQERNRVFKICQSGHKGRRGWPFWIHQEFLYHFSTYHTPAIPFTIFLTHTHLFISACMTPGEKERGREEEKEKEGK